MKKFTDFPVTEYDKFPQKYYFLSIINEIIKISNLKSTKKTILDFGCGNKIFSKFLPNKKIFNYDINPLYSEVKSYKSLKFDIVIFNHVLMYLKAKQIREILTNIKNKNPKCEIVLSLSRQNLISKIAMILTLNFNAHAKTSSTYKEQLYQLDKIALLKKKKTGIFGITDIFFYKFK